MKLSIGMLLLLMSYRLFAADVASLIQEADEYVVKKEFSAAIIQLKNALQLEPENIDARLKLGEIYLIIGNGPAAEKEIKRAKKIGAKPEKWTSQLAQALLYQGRATEVIDSINTNEGLSEKVNSDILSARGQAYLVLQNMSAAAESFKMALDLNKENIPALLGSAKVLLDKKQPGKAVDNVELALALDPTHPFALTLRADLAYRVGDFDLSRKLYQKIVALQPSNVTAITGLAMVELGLKDYSRAHSMANKAIELNKDYSIPYYIKSVVNLSNKNVKEAENNLQRVLSLNPTHLPSLLAMGRVKYNNGDYKSAENYLKSFVSKIPKPTELGHQILK